MKIVFTVLRSCWQKWIAEKLNLQWVNSRWRTAYNNVTTSCAWNEQDLIAWCKKQYE